MGAYVSLAGKEHIVFYRIAVRKNVHIGTPIGRYLGSPQHFEVPTQSSLRYGKAIFFQHSAQFFLTPDTIVTN